MTVSMYSTLLFLHQGLLWVAKEQFQGVGRQSGFSHFGHMGTMEDKLLEDVWATLTMQIKPWLDIKNEDVKSNCNHLPHGSSLRRNSCHQQSLMVMVKLQLHFLKQWNPVKSLIGGKGELCEKLMVCSVEKMPDMLSGLEGLGHLYLKLESKFNEALKSLGPSSEHTDFIKSCLRMLKLWSLLAGQSWDANQVSWLNYSMTQWDSMSLILRWSMIMIFCVTNW